MRRALVLIVFVFFAAGVSLAQYRQSPAESSQASAKPDFKITGTLIEACSCDQFCPCYFNPHPTAHNGAHFCKFNNVLRVEKGYYKSTDLAGVKVWLTGDLGGNFGHGKAEWLVFTFDPSVTEAQKKAMLDILPKLYPLEWRPLGVDTSPITWQVAKNEAHALMGNGKGEVILERFATGNNDASKDVVIQNLKYWAAQSNTGFRMWKNKRHYYEGHDQKFEFSGTNGFLITINFEGSASKAGTD